MSDMYVAKCSPIFQYFLWLSGERSHRCGQFISDTALITPTGTSAGCGHRRHHQSCTKSYHASRVAKTFFHLARNEECLWRRPDPLWGQVPLEVKLQYFYFLSHSSSSVEAIAAIRTHCGRY